MFAQEGLLVPSAGFDVLDPLNIRDVRMDPGIGQRPGLVDRLVL